MICNGDFFLDDLNSVTKVTWTGLAWTYQVKIFMLKFHF